jgi:hypothetical protein
MMPPNLDPRAAFAAAAAGLMGFGGFNQGLNWPYQAPAPPQPLPQPPTISERRYHEDGPSSDDPVEIEDPALFPYIGDWFESIDNGIRGREHGEKTIPYINTFYDNGFRRIVDLETLEVRELVDLCGMLPGSAIRLLKWLRDDIKRVRDNEVRARKRARTRR